MRLFYISRCSDTIFSSQLLEYIYLYTYQKYTCIAAEQHRKLGLKLSSVLLRKPKILTTSPIYTYITLLRARAVHPSRIIKSLFTREARKIIDYRFSRNRADLHKSCYPSLYSLLPCNHSRYIYIQYTSAKANLCKCSIRTKLRLLRKNLVASSGSSLSRLSARILYYILSSRATPCAVVFIAAIIVIARVISRNRRERFL